MEKKIKIVGAYGESNFGDDLLMKVFENFFIKNFSQFKIYFEGVETEYPKRILEKGLYNIDIKEELLVYGGGTQFFSFTKIVKRRNLAQKLFYLFFNPSLIVKKTLQLTRPCRQIQTCKATSFIGIGLGPFNNNLECIKTTSDKLKNSIYVGVRDEVSRSYCDKWEIESFLGADVVFSSYFEFTNFHRNKTITYKKIGVIVRDWIWEPTGKAYINPLLEVIKTNKNYNFEFIILAPNKDKQCFKQFKEFNCLVWDPNVDSINSFLEKLDTFSGFISARYHGAIIGALLGKPIICIEIEEKLRILTEQIKEFSLWEKPFIKNDLLSLFSTFNDNINYDISINRMREKADQMLLNFKTVVDKIHL